MVSTQRQIMEETNKMVLSLKSENRGLEDKVEELTQAMEELKEVRMKEKARLDNLTSFYEIMQKAHHQEDSPVGKTPNSNSDKIIPSQSEVSKKYQAPITQEINDIKSQLNNLAQFLQQSTISNERRRSDYSPIPQGGARYSRFGGLYEPQEAESSQKTSKNFVVLGNYF